MILGIPLHGRRGAEAGERREVADLEEDDDAIGAGEETVRFGGG
jgi:hypothetical protein